MPILEWIQKNVQGYTDLPAEDAAEILDFLLAWSFFEANVLRNNGNVETITNAVDQWGNRNVLDIAPFEVSIEYFGNRYFRDEKNLDRFKDLNFRRNDKEAFVRQALINQAQPNIDQVKAVLIVVYRLRNNLFHGYKWAYGLQNQKSNFEHANMALTAALTTDYQLNR